MGREEREGGAEGPGRGEGRIGEGRMGRIKEKRRREDIESYVRRNRPQVLIQDPQLVDTTLNCSLLLPECICTGHDVILHIKYYNLTLEHIFRYFI